MTCVRCVRELGRSRVRGGTDGGGEGEGGECKPKNKTPHSDVRKTPHSDQSCDDVKKKRQQEESCYTDTMTKSHKSNVHRRPTSDVHKRPTFDVHRRPLNPLGRPGAFLEQQNQVNYSIESSFSLFFN